MWERSSMRGGDRFRRAHEAAANGAVAAIVVIAGGLAVAEQAMTVGTAGGVLHTYVPALNVIEGAVLDRLRDGRAVRVDFELGVLSQAGGTAVVERKQSFNISFDLWEERFALSLLSTPPRSISHLTRTAGESWCLEQMTVPLGELSRFNRSTPFWVRVTYRVPEPTAGSDDDDLFTLQKLIDTLGRKRRDRQPGKSVEGGPFHLSY